MDPRIREHASIIANHSVDMQPGDHVIIDAHPVAHDLVVALHEVIGDVGAHPLPAGMRTFKDARAAYLNALDEVPGTPEHAHALVEAADVYITIRADENVSALADVDTAIQADYRIADKPVRDARLATRWNLTQFPAPGNAQLAGMSTPEYETFVWDAILRDWSVQRDHQAEMAARLTAADQVRIVSGETTDLTMSVAGNPTRNDWAQHNLPGGEIFTAPIPDSVNGTVLYDMPLYYEGREIVDAYLHFENGVVTAHDAKENADLLGEVLDTDEGSRRLGELGIGMNRDIDRFTYNMLFDEKMGDTVHLAVGEAYADTVGEGNEQNRSAVHADMIVDMSEDSYIELDGDVVQRDGTFFFEDGFVA